MCHIPSQKKRILLDKNLIIKCLLIKKLGFQSEIQTAKAKLVKINNRALIFIFHLEIDPLFMVYKNGKKK